MSAILDEAYRVAEQIQLDGARAGLLGFTAYTKPDFYVNWHHRAIAQTINAMFANRTPRQLLRQMGHSADEIKYMLTHPHPVTKLYAGCTRPEMIDQPIEAVQIHIAPRTGKTEVVSRRLPAWYLGNNPKNKIIATSYGADLASMANRDVQRIIDSEEFRSLYPTVGLNDSNVRTVATGSWLRNSDLFEVVGYGGSYKSAGVGGGITGLGANCVMGDALILTDDGLICIKDLVQMPAPPKVWAYNVSNGTRKLCKIKAVQRKTVARVVTARFDNGSSVTCTPEHVFLAEGVLYRPAQVLADCRCSAWNLTYNCQVCQMWQRDAAACNAHDLSSKGQDREDVLRSEVLSYERQVASQSDTSAPLRGVRKSLSAKKQDDTKMLTRLCKQTALTTNEWRAKSNLQARSIADDVSAQPCVVSDEKNNKNERQYALCLMQSSAQGQINGSRAPHRRGQKQQHTAQFSDSLRFLSFDGSQERHTKCTSVDQHSAGQFEVFDLEVEDLGNFYANGINVKNCAIVDDPFKARKSAESPIERHTVASWYQSVLFTRLEKNAKQLIVNTRWHESDLSGFTLSRARRDATATQWFALVLPAILDCEPGPGDFRAQGEALWPQKYDAKRLKTIRATIGPYEFDALYQQRPSPGSGGVIQSNWWQYYEHRPDYFDGHVISADLTFSNRGDYAVFQVWAFKGAMRFLIEERRDRMTFNEQLATAKALSQRYPQAQAFLVENTANGAALINVLTDRIPAMLPIRPTGSKSLRLDAVAPQIQAGNVVLPAPTIAPWIEEWVEEFKNFPNGAHDDRVDACSQALDYLRTQGAAFEPIDFPDLSKESEWDVGGDAPLDD